MLANSSAGTLTDFEATTPVTFKDTWTLTGCEIPTTDIGRYTVHDATTSWLGAPFSFLITGVTGTTTRTLVFPTFYAFELKPGETLINAYY